MRERHLRPCYYPPAATVWDDERPHLRLPSDPVRDKKVASPKERAQETPTFG